MSLKKSTALIATIAFAAAPLGANPVSLDFESLNQTEIYSGVGWLGVATTDLLTTYDSNGVQFSAGVSGINASRAFLPNPSGGTNAITNGIRSGGVDTATQSFTISATGGTWSGISFDYLLTNVTNVTFTAYDSGNNVLVSQVLAAPTVPLTWMSYSLTQAGIASVGFSSSGVGADIFLDNLVVIESVVIPLPGGAALAVAGLGLLGVRRVRRA